MLNIILEDSLLHANFGMLTTQQQFWNERPGQTLTQFLTRNVTLAPNQHLFYRKHTLLI